MISRRHILASMALATAFGATLAQAAEQKAFTDAGFAAAQKAGKPIVVAVHASWCPTCKAQVPILSKIEQDPRFKNLVVFRVDFDAQKDVVKQFNVRMQSTLIAFKGATETARSVGDTNADSINALVAKTL
ncbi:MAG: thioredoxin family protein [Hyphomicrobiales bacterium]|nr:thioredoxin family protein [Hyphomicrobiales bacterium]